MARILIGLEDKTLTEALEEFFLQHSYPQGTQVKLLHAIEIEEAVAAWPSNQYRKDAEELVTSVTALLKQKFPGFEVTGEIVEGYVREQITENAQKWGADLIVVGSHGRHGLSEFILGSVSADVVSQAPCSVAVLPIHAPNKMN